MYTLYVTVTLPHPIKQFELHNQRQWTDSSVSGCVLLSNHTSSRITNEVINRAQHRSRAEHYHSLTNYTFCSHHVYSCIACNCIGYATICPMFDWAGKSYRACNLQLNKLHKHLSHCTVPVTQTGRACSWGPPPVPADVGKLFSCLIEAKTLWMTCFTWHASESGRQPWPVHLRPALLDHSLSLSLSARSVFDLIWHLEGIPSMLLCLFYYRLSASDLPLWLCVCVCVCSLVQYFFNLHPSSRTKSIWCSVICLVIIFCIIF